MLRSIKKSVMDNIVNHPNKIINSANVFSSITPNAYSRDSIAIGIIDNLTFLGSALNLSFIVFQASTVNVCEFFRSEPENLFLIYQ